MLGNAFHFNYFNPTGHYSIKLSNQVEREVALTLLMLNRKYKQIIEGGDAKRYIGTDRSKYGNLSWFRNERISGVSFIYDENFVLPTHGTFEWDFVYLLNTPAPEDETSEDKIEMIKDVILTFEGNLDQQITAFRAFSEYLALSSDQLGDFIDLIDDAKWKTECYISGIGKLFFFL